MVMNVPVRPTPALFKVRGREKGWSQKRRVKKREEETNNRDRGGVKRDGEESKEMGRGQGKGEGSRKRGGVKRGPEELTGVSSKNETIRKRSKGARVVRSEFHMQHIC